jgi:hypothetical protein
VEKKTKLKSEGIILLQRKFWNSSFLNYHYHFAPLIIMFNMKHILSGKQNIEKAAGCKRGASSINLQSAEVSFLLVLVLPLNLLLL